METVKNRLLSLALFAPGPFYFFPPKALLCKLVGGDFAAAYYHFRQNHRNAVNLSLHVVCFFVQLAGNFALLAQLDARVVPQRIAGVRVLSAASALMWSVVNLRSGASKAASLLASACIAGAYFAAPHITPRLLDHATFGGFLLTLLAANVATGIVARADMLQVFLGLPALMAGFHYAEDNYAGFGADRAPEVRAALLGYVAAVPLLLRNPLKPLVVSAVFLCRAAYVATGDDALFYLGYAFLASLLQGITHRVSREEATLIALERKGDSAKITFEYGHVIYFPTLAVSSVLDSLRGVAPPPKPASLKE